jgi:hypothetical protein
MSITGARTAGASKGKQFVSTDMPDQVAVMEQGVRGKVGEDRP